MSNLALPMHITSLLKSFSALSDKEKLEKIMDIGQKLPPMKQSLKKTENLVTGCQSKLYAHIQLKGQILLLDVDSDALISKGLAALFMQAYSGQTIQFLFQNPPVFFSDIGLFSMLSMQRQQGFLSLYKHTLKAVSTLVNNAS